MSQETITARLIKKIVAAFLLVILIVGVSYVFITYYFTSMFFEETSQKLNAQIASHVINEKFQNESPFLADGTVNKPLFGDLMHDMMAVNRGIEVYLVSKTGEIRYSVVLDHSDTEEPATTIDTQPLDQFIAYKGTKYMLGDDPRNPGSQKIFSAAAFNINDQEGYIYIILASQQFEEIANSGLGSYFLQLGLGASIATIIFAALIGVLSIWYLTGSLREITETVRRFRDGDLAARVADANQKDLSILSETFNEMADTLVANIDELKSVESLRRELIANVSHDLRTPLAITKGYIETLQIKKEQLSKEDQDKYLKIINGSIEKLSLLIDQLFEYSKLEAKQVVPHKEPFAIADLAHDVFEKYQQLASRQDISLKLKVESQLPMVFADISLVERVIQNLMDNALKFTPEKGVVTIFLQATDKEVVLSIKDTGAGIPASQLAEIFERYKQTSLSEKNQKHGAGLGLAIARKIMEIHDSTIDVISKPNFGTTFQFKLPMATL